MKPLEIYYSRSNNVEDKPIKDTFFEYLRGINRDWTVTEYKRNSEYKPPPYMELDFMIVGCKSNCNVGRGTFTEIEKAIAVGMPILIVTENKLIYSLSGIIKDVRGNSKEYGFIRLEALNDSAYFKNLFNPSFQNLYPIF